MQPVIDWFPTSSAIVGAKCAGSRDRDGYSFWIARIEQNCVQTHPARAGLPFWTRIAAAEPGQFIPRFSAVVRFEQRGVFHTGIDVIGIVERRFQMPDTLKFPWMLRAIVPLMRREWFTCFWRSVVNELVALAFWHAVRAFQFLRTAARRVPAFAAVIGTLDDLPKPTAGLGRVNPIRINRRTFHVINLPA